MHGAVFTFGCLEPFLVQGIRRAIVHNGGVYREYYGYPGVSLDAEFRTEEGRLAACEKIVGWENKCWDNLEDHLSPSYYIDEYERLKPRPIERYEVVNGLGKETVRYHPKHPIKGGKDAQPDRQERLEGE